MNYRCPECNGPVTLKKGIVVAAHFAHRPGAQCAHGEGETPWHRNTKIILYEALKSAGHLAEIEYPIGNRRADVVAQDVTTVLEVQFSKNDLSDIYERSRDYWRNGYKTIWIFPWNPLYSESEREINPGLSKISAPPSLKAISGRYPKLQRPPGSYAAFFSEHGSALLYCTFYDWSLIRDIWEEGSGCVGTYFPSSVRWIGAKIVRKINISSEPLRLWNTASAPDDNN